MRLDKIFSFVDECDIFADIGCDHGYLSKAVADSGKAKRIICTDISEKCLSKAKELLGSRAEYRLGDGFEALGDITPDVAVISGMGGNTVLHIVGERKIPTLIVSPQGDVCKVRNSLTRSGYKITEDEVVKEGKRYYDVIKLSPGSQDLSDLQCEFGVFFGRGTPEFVERLQRDKQNLLSYKNTPQNLYKLELIRRAEECLR